MLCTKHPQPGTLPQDSSSSPAQPANEPEMCPAISASGLGARLRPLKRPEFPWEAKCSGVLALIVRNTTHPSKLTHGCRHVWPQALPHSLLSSYPATAAGVLKHPDQEVTLPFLICVFNSQPQGPQTCQEGLAEKDVPLIKRF